jgi:hypothetical protein
MNRSRSIFLPFLGAEWFDALRSSMKLKCFAAALGFAVCGFLSTPIGADVVPARSPLFVVQTDQEKLDTAQKDSPLTREEILKQGPPALEKHCIGCHLADKWEGTNRDRDGWSVIVAEMSKLMDDAKKPPMDDKTFNLVVDYLSLTRPQ